MIRHLQRNLSKAVDASKKAKVDMKRGAFVKVNEATGDVELAVALANVNGIAVRDVVVDTDVAMGIPVSDYSDTQDIVKAGEFVGVETIQVGERYATTEYLDTLVDADVVADKYLAVANGKLIASATATKIISLGWVQDNEHKLLGYKFV
jgi:hypothetical protein